ncbi:hypothetical protein M9H77_10845 [Catharanthus roseus]|uniref:Uncharacterized protein n=1 Tax=Catharanthus roseus TaxID=4058 RepID=A0ACC0BCX5_CATRO|nr:hypothetical protein M9H77_10845 [Catharanthus roseus]
MFAKLFQKPANSASQESPTSADVAPRVPVHYGIPSTASTLTFDPIQHLLAVGTLDGRIKIIGGDNIEGLLMSPKPTPFKYLEFLQNQGFLVSVSHENEIQVWDLESRCMSCSLQWESNITAFSVIYGTQYMYIGDEYGFLSVLKYDAEEGKVLQLPYHVPANLVAETADVLLSNNQSIVGILAQPLSSGNRVLIAYENGLIVLWDVTEDRAVLIRGSKDLELEEEILVGSSLSDEGHQHMGDLSDREGEEKEISSLCWVSTDGSILAVGYVDGDILLWNLSVSDTSKGQTAQKPSNKVVKMQLSSGERRLPVIVLHWSPTKTKMGCGGQLFVYGGEEIGSEEVLTILDLDWSSGIAMVKCVHRFDLPLNGSFADMIVIPSFYEAVNNETASLLVLTTPGQLYFYSNDCLSLLKSEPEKKHSVLAVQYPATIPTVEPRMTVGKLYSATTMSNCLRILPEAVSAAKLKTQQSMKTGTNGWPLSGGVPGQLSSIEDTGIKRIYIAGYQDGTVRIWDVTFPVLSLLVVLEVEVKEIAGANASISALEFSSTSSTLAVGNEFGLVFLYQLDRTHDKSGLPLITQKQREVYSFPHERKSQCIAIFPLLNSPVSCLQWVISEEKLAVGFESGQVAMLETSSLSVLFLIDTVSSSRSAVMSLAVKRLPDIQNNSLNHSESETSNEPMKELVFVFTRDGHCISIDGTTGKAISQPVYPREASTAISFFILEEVVTAEGSEEHFPVSSQNAEAKHQPVARVEVESHKQPADTRLKFVDSLILLCFENVLHLYSSKSIFQGDSKSIFKLDLAKPCAWTTIFKKHAKEYGLILVYQSGDIEIRSFPDFKLSGSTSLTSLLRWNFKSNMEKLMSSSDRGQITLVNGCEFAVVSLLAFENDFRIPDALPCLHDKVLSAAVDATSGFFEDQKSKQSNVPGVLGGIMKGMKAVKKDTNNYEARETVIAHLESIFSRFPFSDPLKDLEIFEGDLQLNIDDIEIEEPVSVSSSTFKSNNDRKEKEAEREKLFEGGSTDTKPRLRTREEIIAKYRKTGDATSAASQAKDKLMERQEKLEKLSRRTEELQSGAESFASMANELAKNMERRKWWNI